MEILTSSAPRSGIALSSLPATEEDDTSTRDSPLSQSSDIDIMNFQSEAPVHVQERVTHMRADDDTAAQDEAASVKKMVEGNLRTAEQRLKDFEKYWRDTGSKPKIKGGKPRMQRRIEQLRATLDALPLVTISDQPAGRTRAKSRSSVLLSLAHKKAKELVKAQGAARSQRNPAPRSDIPNEDLRETVLLSKYSSIPNVPTMLDQTAGRGLLAKHGVDAEKAKMKFEAALPTPPPKRKKNRRVMPKKPVGGNSKANPITID